MSHVTGQTHATVFSFLQLGEDTIYSIFAFAHVTFVTRLHFETAANQARGAKAGSQEERVLQRVRRAQRVAAAVVLGKGKAKARAREDLPRHHRPGLPEDLIRHLLRPHRLPPNHLLRGRRGQRGHLGRPGPPGQAKHQSRQGGLEHVRPQDRRGRGQLSLRGRHLLRSFVPPNQPLDLRRNVAMALPMLRGLFLFVMR